MESIWSRDCHMEKRDPLTRSIETEIAVVGAGMAGVLIAHALQREGRRVVVLEADRTGSGQTRNTTAKVTSQHGLIYRKLIRTFGWAKAAHYAQANQEAIQAYRDIIQVEGIDCGWEEKRAYVYGDDGDRLRAEAEAAASLGLPASYTGDLPCPIPAVGAVKFQGQAQFHPLRFLRPLAEKLTIYEGTPVRTIEGGVLKTPGGTVRAEKIIFACHYPFLNFPGLYFARMHQERSYVLALEGAPAVDGMYISADGAGLSLRTCGDLLLVGGEGHRTGENGAGGQYERLLQTAREWLPVAREAARWSAQDCITADGVPYIGPYAASRPNWYVATGFGKWGMTSSMAAALILPAILRGEDHPWADVFDPRRVNGRALAGIAAEGGHAVKGLAKSFLYFPATQADELSAGRGGIVRLNGEKAGAYRDEDGQLHAVSPRCPHLGCQLAWNPAEKTWDCPCHGSRFDCQGKLLSGPAQEDISREQPSIK